MKFSIIVAAYNVAEYLEECIESLVSQNFPDSEYEVLIVDDGSTDGRTGMICDQLTSEFEVVVFNDICDVLKEILESNILREIIYYLLMVMTFGVIQTFLINYRRTLINFEVM